MRDFAVRLTHRPGELARVAGALSRYGVNIKSICALAIDNYVLARIVADDVESARFSSRTLTTSPSSKRMLLSSSAARADSTSSATMRAST